MQLAVDEKLELNCFSTCLHKSIRFVLWYFGPLRRAPVKKRCSNIKRISTLQIYSLTNFDDMVQSQTSRTYCWNQDGHWEVDDNIITSTLFQKKTDLPTHLKQNLTNATTNVTYFVIMGVVVTMCVHVTWQNKSAVALEWVVVTVEREEMGVSLSEAVACR